MDALLLTHLVATAAAASGTAVAGLAATRAHRERLLTRLAAANAGRAEAELAARAAQTATLEQAALDALLARMLAEHDHGQLPPSTPLDRARRVADVLQARADAERVWRRRLADLSQALSEAHLRQEQLTQALAQRQAAPDRGEGREDAEPQGERRRRMEAEARLHEARKELEDLRTKLRFANRAIVGLERELHSGHRVDPLFDPEEALASMPPRR